LLTPAVVAGGGYAGAVDAVAGGIGAGAGAAGVYAVAAARGTVSGGFAVSSCLPQADNAIADATASPATITIFMGIPRCKRCERGNHDSHIAFHGRP
jgi:hypothetical protein